MLYVLAGFWALMTLRYSARVLQTANPERVVERRKRDGPRYRSGVVMDYAMVPLSGALFLLNVYQINNPGGLQ